MGGVICGTKEFIRKTVENYMKHTGGSMSPFTAWMHLNGMATLDLLGDLAGEDEDACELLIELLLEPIDLKLPDHVKRVLVAERYEAMTRLASIDWERARTTFQRLPFQGLRDVLRPALAEGLAASGLPYEDAFVVAQNA